MPNFTGVATDALETTNVGGAQSGALRSTGNVNVQTAYPTGNGNAAATTDTVLFTYQLPANSFVNAGAQVTVTASGSFAANANNKQVKVWWGTTTQTVGSAVAGGTLIAQSGVVTTNGGGWEANVQVQKYGAAGSNTQIATAAQVIAGATHLGTAAPTALTAAENAPINITVTGASSTTGAANDVVGNQFDIAFNN